MRSVGIITIEFSAMNFFDTCRRGAVAIFIAAWSFSSYAHSNKYTASLDVLHGFENTDLNQRAKSDLDGFIANSETKGFEVLIAVGHAAKGERNAQSLSEFRAMTVKFYLMQLGVPPSRIYTEGKADSQPLDGREQTPNRRTEIEFVGLNSIETDVTGFNFMNIWLADPVHPPNDVKRDKWSGVTPLKFLPQITDKRLRSNFLRKLQLVAIRNKDDDFLRTVWVLPGADLVDPNEVISPALYASVFGTGYARQLLNGELAKLRADDPTRMKFAQRLWCGRLGPESLIEAIETVLSAPTVIAKLPPHEQLGWLRCAAQRANELDVLWLRKLGVSSEITNTGISASPR